MESSGTQQPSVRFQRLQSLFSRATELPASERRKFIIRETVDDPSLQLELLSVLDADLCAASGPITDAMGAAIAATARDRRRSALGKVLGNYRLVNVLGHGGTGTVYLAERADRQYSAQVAVKVVDNAGVHPDLGVRFRGERQILARLNHPNIARLLDAGETPEGYPYIVMEYVHGEPVDRYCDRQQLGLNDRLKLFLEICAAVQYAHQNLIVHRDLKPANILVTPEGTPKLLDFGIAKLLGADESAMIPALTRVNDRLLTPEYASPEQILGQAVTTASDVYALGVVLYELLTGLRPYTIPPTASQLELERSICVSDPQKPSAAVRRALDRGPIEGQSDIEALAAARHLTPERLARRLSGDLDAIAMRALRKEPQHRYSVVQELAADICRHLANEPVLARQGNWLYYSQRFVRRHTLGVATGTGFFLFFIAVAVTMSIQFQRTAAERDRATQEWARAERVSNFMVEVFSSADPFQHRGQVVTAQGLLDQAARGIRGVLHEHPQVRARLLETIGRAYHRQGHPERAIPYLEDALFIRERELSSTDPALGSTLAELAVALRKAARFEEADRVFQRALRVSAATRNQRTLAHARLLVDIGRLFLDQGQIDDATRYLTEGLTLTRELRGARDPEVAAVLAEIANAHLWRDDLEGAEQAARQAVSIYQETVDEFHPDRVMASQRLADVLLFRGRVDAAGLLYERVLNAQRQLYGEISSPVADTTDSLAQVRFSQGRLDEAEDIARTAVEIHTELRGAQHYITGYMQSSLARVLLAREKYAEAEAALLQAQEAFASSLPPDHQYVAAAEYLLGEVYLMTGRPADAEAVLSASMNRWQRSSSAGWRIARSESALGYAIHLQGRSQEAEKHLVESYRTLSVDSGADPDATRRARQRLIRFYRDMGQAAKLEGVLLPAGASGQSAGN